ncbi:MAG TPA: cation-translocating P-type ATPase [Acidimicrobiales bacterium]|nr:cation-translocating P-type ATPase [Acidimicrobiales bacterium]
MMNMLPGSVRSLPAAVVRRVQGDPGAARPGRRTRRVVRTGAGRAHLAVRGVHRPDREPLARTVERALAAIEGVHWAEVNPILAEVVVAFEDGAVDPEDLAGVLDGVEEAHGLRDEPFAPDMPDHPADDGPIRRGAAALIADGFGFGIGIAARALRLPRLPVEVASAVPAVDSLPPVHRILEARPRLGMATAMVNALLQGLGQGPLGLVVDATQHLNGIAELAARRRAWLAAEPRLHRAPPAEHVPAAETAQRPAPLPLGPVETYGQGVSLVSLAGAGATLALTRDPRRTADVLLAGLPRAARLGREAFAAQIGRELATRQVIAMDPRVLRRLDRVDTVVLDARAVTTGTSTIAAVVAVADLDEAAVAARARALFDPGRADDTPQDGDWALAPVTQVATGWPRGARARARRLAAGGAAVVCLTRRGAVVGLVAVQPELRGFVSGLVDAVRQAGHRLVVAGTRSGVAAVVGAEAAVAGGDHLSRSVRELQAAGSVVALVSARPGAALRAADCGIGILGADEIHPPWGADLLCLHAEGAATAVDATGLARAASRHAVAFAAAGSTAAGWFAVSALPGAGRRTMTAVQLSSLAAMGSGMWNGAQLPRRPAHADPRPVPWHVLEPHAVLARLGTQPGGLTAEAAAARAEPDDQAHPPGLPALVRDELANPLSAILGAGAALSAAAGSVLDAMLIAGVVGVDALVGAAQRVRTEAAIARLTSSIAEGAVRVVRAGAETVTSARELVPGDVVLLAAGDAVPADARVLESVGLETDESSLTGESLPVAKDPKAVGEVAVADRSSMVYAGTAVAAGRGTAVVVATGSRTEARQGESDAAQPPPTGVEARLRALTDRAVPVVLASGAGLALNSLLRGRPAREAMASGVSLAAAAVPEGLPFVATVAQASAAHRLAGRGVLVRHPQVLEALGRVDVLCFDKTGTLTEGRLKLRCVSDGEGDEPVTALGPTGRYVLAAALRATPRARAGGLPHPTDQAIVESTAVAAVHPSHGVESWEKAVSLPFEPGRAYHAVLGWTASGARLCVKGAPEVVLPRCETWRRPSGRVVLDPATRTELDGEVERLARRGLRVLAIAERGASDRRDLDDDRIERLELVGFVGVADAARPSAAAPLETLWRAGTNVVMVTGDHPSTAEAIASDLGLLNGRAVLTGPQLDELDDDAIDELVDTVGVFARVTPAHKVRIVAAYQRAGRVVAMTGDGANDAQAIRLADIGVAFGPRATAAARDAADLVVTEDDLEILVETVAEGRAMWASVRDALAILLGGNLGEVAFTVGAAFLSGSPPLTARQLLAVNLLTDLAPAMAIAVQAPRTGTVDLAREGPETSLAGQLARDVTIRATATAAGAYGAWVAARLTGTPGRARSVALASLVGSQLGQTLVIGRRSPLVIGTALVSAAGLVAVVQTPGVSHFFDCRPLGPVGWTIAAGASGLATVGAAAASALLPSR